MKYGGYLFRDDIDKLEETLLIDDNNGNGIISKEV